MAKSTRLSKTAKEFNVGIATIVAFLEKKGIAIESSPHAKLDMDIYNLIAAEYSKDHKIKQAAEEVDLKRQSKETVSIGDSNKALEKKEIKTEIPKTQKPKVIGTIDIKTKPKVPVAKKEEVEQEKEELVKEKISEKEETKTVKPKAEKEEVSEEQKQKPKVIGKIDLDFNQRTRPKKKTKAEKEEEKQQRKKAVSVVEEKSITSKKEEENKAEKPINPKKVEDFIKTKVTKLSGPTVVGTIELEDPKKTKPSDKKRYSAEDKKKHKRKRINKGKVNPLKPNNKPNDSRGKKPPFNKKQQKGKRLVKKEVNEEDVQKQIKETLARLTNKAKGKGAKYRRDKRDADKEKVEKELQQQAKEKNILKVTEFISVSELASMMDVPPTDVISTCMNLGLFVSINQRLDAETMAIVADEFSYKVEFVSVKVQEAVDQEEDKEEDLLPRPPIVTVMGHVDHGKTKLLDYIRNANVIAGEAGGITQHIGAYSVELKNGKRVSFLDTPGHEAFTAMRARGANVTDIVIVIVAADDGLMPQTKEAINHASAAGVPIIFAINKIDKPTSNPDKIKEELAQINYMVEEWGGKYQSQDISALKGTGVEELLEKVLLEAEMLDLKANPNKKAEGTIIESELDKGRGYVSTVLVKAGTLRPGDVVLAGSYYGHVKAMFDERGKRMKEATPSVPAQILGLNGAPPSGDKFNVMSNDAEARNIANKREQLERQQTLKTQKHITLDEIGRRLAIGNFQELNIIVKGDVDGSIEALTDSFIKLSTEEIQINVIHKAVGEISESDVMLANVSNAIIIGFQVRPSLAARKLAEKENIDIRLYSIIYDAINELKDAMSGMLAPEVKEEIVSTIEVREVFKISKVGTIAGCMVKEGKIHRNTKIRLIRDGIVVYTGVLGSLKRFKDDVKEVNSGYECGLNIENFNDIKVGDIIEGYEEKEYTRSL